MFPRDAPTRAELLDSQSCHYLYVFPLGLIVEHVGHVLGEDLLAARARVDANHGDSNGPGSVPNGHLQVGIVGLGREGQHSASHKAFLHCQLLLNTHCSLPDPVSLPGINRLHNAHSRMELRGKQGLWTFP